MINQVPEEIMKQFIGDGRHGKSRLEVLESIVRQLEAEIPKLLEDLKRVENDSTEELIISKLNEHRENLRRAKQFLEFKYLIKGNFGDEISD